MSAERLAPGWVIGCDAPGCESALYADRVDPYKAYDVAEAHGWGTRGERDECPIHVSEAGA